MTLVMLMRQVHNIALPSTGIRSVHQINEPLTRRSETGVPFPVGIFSDFRFTYHDCDG